MDTKQQSLLKNEVIREIKLEGEWLNDTWDLSIGSFDIYNPNGKKLNGLIEFSILKNENFKNEIKFFIQQNIKSYRWSVSCDYKFKRMNELIQLISSNYPFCYSIIDLNIDNISLKLRNFMKEMQFGDERIRYILLLFRNLNNYYMKKYDIRNEFEKDIWDVRNINPSKISIVATKYYFKFVDIPQAFKKLAKNYLRVCLNRYSFGYCEKKIRQLRLFSTFISERHPDWNDLCKLDREDIERYIEYMNDVFKKSKNTEMAVWSFLIELKLFLGYIQAADYSESPVKPVHTLLFKEDMPKWQVWNFSTEKYIPEYVLQQFDDNIEFLKKTYIPIAIVLRATGMRISDVLTMRYSKCLELVNGGWYVVADLSKTKTINHRIPITKEVAIVIKGQVEIAKNLFQSGINPNKFLFVSTSPERMGRPPSSRNISRVFNKLAVDRKIVDEEGNVFHFRNHAFRHTKAVELINNGMNLLHVQKWLGHETPEMTLKYAKLLDTTMRKSWEQVVKSGLFRVSISDGKLEELEPSTENNDLIEWEYIRKNLDAVRIPLGYCFKPDKVQCNHQLNPCLTCSNMCTSPEFTHEFEIEIDETKKQIERAKRFGRTVWVEKNEIALDKLNSILNVLKEGKLYHKAGKKKREYVGDERNE